MSLRVPAAMSAARGMLRGQGWQTRGRIWTIELPDCNWGRIWIEPGATATGFGVGIVCGRISALLEGREAMERPGVRVVEHLTVVARTDIFITDAEVGDRPVPAGSSLRADRPAVLFIPPEAAEAWWTEALMASSRAVLAARSSHAVCRMLLSAPEPSLLDARYAALLARLSGEDRLLDEALASAELAYAKVAPDRLTPAIDSRRLIPQIGRLTHRAFVLAVEALVPRGDRECG